MVTRQEIEHKIVQVIFVAAYSLLALSACDSVPASTSIKENPPEMNGNVISQLTNEYRKSLGLNVLEIDPVSVDIACKKAHAIYVTGEVHDSHRFIDPSTNILVEPLFYLQSRLNYRAAYENIGVNQSTPSEMLIGWINSPSHNQNLEAKAQSIGTCVVDGPIKDSKIFDEKDKPVGTSLLKTIIVMDLIEH